MDGFDAYLGEVFSGGSDGKESTCSARDLGSVPGLGRCHPPSPLSEKGITTHFSFLAWRILWTEEPGGLQSMGSQTVRHN